MSKFHNIQQNTDEWFQLRSGKLTSSNMGKVMANYGKAFGEPAKKYASQIAVEQITGKPLKSDYTNDHMERGHQQEPLARLLYENETFSTIQNGGFFESDFVGCSPDGLVGNGRIEIKSVITNVHFSNIKRGGIDPAYKWQCYSNIKYTGGEWLDFISYCDDFPEYKKLYVYRIMAKDLEEEFSMMDKRVSEFKDLVKESKDFILKTNYINQ